MSSKSRVAHAEKKSHAADKHMHLEVWNRQAHRIALSTLQGISFYFYWKAGRYVNDMKNNTTITRVKTLFHSISEILIPLPCLYEEPMSEGFNDQVRSKLSWLESWKRAVISWLKWCLKRCKAVFYAQILCTRMLSNKACASISMCGRTSPLQRFSNQGWDVDVAHCSLWRLKNKRVKKLEDLQK